MFRINEKTKLKVDDVSSFFIVQHNSLNVEINLMYVEKRMNTKLFT